MNKYIWIGFLLLLVVSVKILDAKEKLNQPIKQNPIIYTDYLVAVYPQIKKEKQSEIETLVSYYSEKWNVDGEQIEKTIKCESNNNFLAVGDNNTSFGLAQIHLPAHPEITKQEALNPIFSIEFMVKEFSKGNHWKWTCFNKLFVKK